MKKNISNPPTIPEPLHGLRIDAALAQLFPEYSRSQITQWIKSGFIKINNLQIKPKEKAIQGAVVNLPSTWPPEIPNPDQFLPEAIPLDIKYEDDAFLVVNKPANLVVHPAQGHWQHTLVNALLYYLPQLQNLPRAGIVHRLDRDTTGLLLVAKTLQAQTNLVRQLKDRSIQRIYIALVADKIISGGTIRTYFGRSPHNRLKMAVLSQGKEAVTHYRVLQRFEHFTLLEISLETGRTHQIRVHMSHIRHPIIGDPLYPPRAIKGLNHLDGTLQSSLQSFKRQALHATRICLAHPLTGMPMTINAPLPDDFQNLIHLLSQEDAHESP